MSLTRKQRHGLENSLSRVLSQTEKWTQGLLPMSSQTTCGGSSNVIGSLEFWDGLSPCGLLDGQNPAPFGQALAPASHSQPPAKDSEPQTNVTSGPCSPNSSAPASLQQSLANRLRQRLAGNGSPEYSLTWKEWAISGQEPICALRASAHRTSGKGCGGWPTPGEDNANNAYGQKGTDYSDLPTTAQKASGQPPSGISVATAKPAALNPAFSLWLMGYPAEWASCGARAMQSCRKSRRSS